ncbi:hypothetical protein BT96DRAFT_911939 [Gymnopus androsaceus JB14]|uniref:DUF6533 domain-containing protein n=1 Tax=Gymnopus androsaceus JB14 TaxID=1447944 RepID=A0A6A4ILG2_9AGAR|nr:hypothetical protein BT96DRAFT_911939 [Gymnopus androsaceus JB14]
MVAIHTSVLPALHSDSALGEYHLSLPLISLLSLEMQAQIGASVLGLLLTSCDSLLTRHKELEYVWNSRRPTFVRCLFILAKYLAFSIHIGNIVLTSLWTIRFRGHERPTEDVCMTWQIFQSATCYIMLLILELILSLKVGIFLSTMLAGRMAGTIYVIRNRVDAQQLKFTRHCISEVIGEIAVQLVIHGLALRRTFWDLRHYTFARPPLFSVLNRDGLKIFAAISLAMVSIGVSAGREAIPVVLIYPIFISLISTAVCRTILNLQTLDITTRETPSSERNKEFTSINDISIWDTTTRPEQDTRSRSEGTH